MRKLSHIRRRPSCNFLLERGGLFPFFTMRGQRSSRHAADYKRRISAIGARITGSGAHALARAVIAQLHLLAIEHQRPGPSRNLRMQLFERLVLDWGQRTFGVGAFLIKCASREEPQNCFENIEKELTQRAVLPLGDIALYQAHGHKVRQFISGKIASATPPVVLLGHSLGGVACVDLLISERFSSVSHLITVGSQAPLLYERAPCSC